jgi:transcriptional regulator with XRE-family HTH domain
MLSHKDVKILDGIYIAYEKALEDADDPQAILDALSFGKTSPTNGIGSGKGEGAYVARPNKKSKPNNKYRKIRVAMNLTQSELAKRAKVNENQVVRLEHGEKIMRESFERITKALGLEGEKPPQPSRRYSPRRQRDWKGINQKSEERMRLFRDDRRLISLTTQLRDLRNRAGYTQEALSQKAGLGVMYMGNIENMRRMPTQAAMARIMKTLGVPLEVLGDISWLTEKRSAVPAKPLLSK